MYSKDSARKSKSNEPQIQTRRCVSGVLYCRVPRDLRVWWKWTRCNLRSCAMRLSGRAAAEAIGTSRVLSRVSVAQHSTAQRPAVNNRLSATRCDAAVTRTRFWDSQKTAATRGRTRTSRAARLRRSLCSMRTREGQIEKREETEGSIQCCTMQQCRAELRPLTVYCARSYD